MFFRARYNWPLKKPKPANDQSAGFRSRSAFEHGVRAWRVGTQFALSNFVLIPK
jgi:hypothetical protein